MSKSDELKKHLALIAANKDRILDAIKHQRWFRLENTKTVIFDRDTNLLWFDINCSPQHPFPYGKIAEIDKNGKVVKEKNKIPYPIDKNYAEVQKMLDDKNKHWLGNCMDWTIPTADEFRQLVEDETFPLYRKIKEMRKWCTQSGCIDLERGVDNVSDEDAFIIPCSHAYVPRAPKSTLDIFINNQIDPIFVNGAISEIYRRLYNPPAYPTIRRPTKPAIKGFERTDLLEYIAELEAQLSHEREHRPSFVFSLT